MRDRIMNSEHEDVGISSPRPSLAGRLNGLTGGRALPQTPRKEYSVRKLKG